MIYYLLLVFIKIGIESIYIVCVELLIRVEVVEKIKIEFSVIKDVWSDKCIIRL